MKCKDCEAAVKDFFKCAPDKYVCIGVKEPFVIEDIDVECTEYKPVTLTAEIKPSEPVKPYVGDDGVYVPYEYDPRYHKLLISRDLFVEAYNKWIKGEPNVFDNPFAGQDDADDWCED
jgi:hypothetical protein